jgi:hypothetical protein
LIPTTTNIWFGISTSILGWLLNGGGTGEADLDPQHIDLLTDLLLDLTADLPLPLILDLQADLLLLVRDMEVMVVMVEADLGIETPLKVKEDSTPSTRVY